MEAAALSNELTLGQRLARARKHARYSQTRMSEIVGVSRVTVSNYENDRGEAGPPFDVIAKWGGACGVSLDYFAEAVAPSTTCNGGSHLTLVPAHPDQLAFDLGVPKRLTVAAPLRLRAVR